MNRVVVTGMGVIAPNATTVPRFRDALVAGTSGIGPITLFDPATLPTRIAAEVKWIGDIDRDRKVTFALAAAQQALEDSGRPDGEGGLSLGLGLELFSMEDACSNRRMTMKDQALRRITQTKALTAPPIAHVSACAAGTDAIGCAFQMIRSGRRRWMLAGGTDSMINPLGIAGFCSIGATSTQNDDPPRASRPFDRRRSGFVLGEGAGILLLERLDDATARGAAIHAEICGYGTSFDAHGISEPHPDGRGALQAMARALRDAKVNPEDIDAINAHGTSTPKNDPVETLAIKRLFGDRARKIPVSATKSMIGHLISAAGAVEAIAAIACMNAGIVHPTMNLDEPDPLCDLDYVPHIARDHRQQYVLSSSFAFGGQNAALVMRSGRTST